MTRTHGFRFGIVATPGDAETWRETARRAAAHGFDTLLVPDVPQLPAPFPALAIAAATADIRVGTWVLAAPLRPPASTAWEAESLSRLTGGRFELGIGAGRAALAYTVRAHGLPWGSPGERLHQVAETIDALRAREAERGSARTPVLLAAGGPRARALAIEKADAATVPISATTSRDSVAAAVTDLRKADVELAMGLFVVGDHMPPHVQRYTGTDLAGLRAAESITLLEGSPREMADELLRRREHLGLSYVTVNAEYADAFAPVVALLAGR